LDAGDVSCTGADVLRFTIGSFIVLAASGVAVFVAADPSPIAFHVVFLISLGCFLIGMAMLLSERAAKSMNGQVEDREHPTTRARTGGPRRADRHRR
jgi:hypothetical protein